MQIEKIELEKLKPLERNVRKHGPTQIKELVRSLNQFGQTRAIVIDEDYNILIGNGLYLAMKERGDKTCDVYKINGLTKSQKNKLIISDNKVYELGFTNYDTLEEMLKEISASGDFDIAGFDEETIKEITASAEASIEEIKEYANVSETQFGSIPTRETSVSNVSNDQQVESTEYQNQETPIVEVQNHNDERKFVVCPNCGEVIYLD